MSGEDPGVDSPLSAIDKGYMLSIGAMSRVPRIPAASSLVRESGIEVPWRLRLEFCTGSVNTELPKSGWSGLQFPHPVM